jgi:hypothetical protein
VFEDADESGWVAGGVPSGEGFSIDGGELVDLVRVTTRDTCDCVADGAEEGDKEGGYCGFGMVSKAEAAAFYCVVG